MPRKHTLTREKVLTAKDHERGVVIRIADGTYPIPCLVNLDQKSHYIQYVKY